MSFKKYFLDSLWKVCYFLILFFIINIVLFVSSPISKSINDIIYLDILISLISIAFFIYGYYKWNNTYKEYTTALKNKKNLELVLPKGSNLESQLLKDTLQIKNNQLAEKTAELHELLEEINNYITQWVHEIKIPIAVCELISDKLNETSDNNKDLGKISEELKMELERIKFLIDQVLYASRSTGYSEDLIIEEVNLGKIVKETVKKNASFFISKNITIKLDNLNHIILTDRKWISYILSQIFNNAYKYVNKNGAVEIYAVQNEKSIKLKIKDNGIGIKPKDIKRIFDKGFTGENGRKFTKSTGMGLYYSKKMLDKLGHSISISSIPDEYTEFTIVFYIISDYFNVTKM